MKYDIKRPKQPKPTKPFPWRTHEYMWVIGCITSNGSIIASPSKEGRTHRPEETVGKRFRWCIWSQEFHEVFMGGQEFKDEELFTVWNWLRERDFTDDKTMPKPTTEE
jgi:hypothetical protein